MTKAKEKKPDVVAFSVYYWALDLTKYVANQARKMFGNDDANEDEDDENLEASIKHNLNAARYEIGFCTFCGGEDIDMEDDYEEDEDSEGNPAPL